MQWVLSIFDRFRFGDRPAGPTRTERRAAAAYASSLRARRVDAEAMRTEITTHLANTQMATAPRAPGYDLLIPGHKPIRFSPPTANAAVNPPNLPYFYEETTTLVLSYLITRFQTAVLFDVGAGLGYFSRVAASHAKHPAKAYAFEMRPDRMERLLANIAGDSFGSRVFPQQVALTDAHKGANDIWYASSTLFETRPDTADYRERWRWLKFNFRGGFNGNFATANVLMTSIDHFVETSGVWPDVIKIDVDGYEGRVLEGGANLLARRRPFILLELHKDKKLRFGVRRRDIADHLFEIGYQALFLTDHQDRLKCEVIEIRPGDPLIDRQETDLILFLHPDFQRNAQGRT